MLKGFKDFLMRGNVIDLAVAVVIGAAFGAVVTKLVEGVINPLISALFGQPNLDTVGSFSIGAGKFFIGPFLTATLNFVLVAATIYFVIIVPMNKLMSLRKRDAQPEPEQQAPTQDVLLLQEIRDLLRAQHEQR